MCTKKLHEQMETHHKDPQNNSRDSKHPQRNIKHMCVVWNDFVCLASKNKGVGGPIVCLWKGLIVL